MNYGHGVERRLIETGNHAQGGNIALLAVVTTEAEVEDA